MILGTPHFRKPPYVYIWYLQCSLVTTRFHVPRLQLHYATAIRLLAHRDTTARKYQEVIWDMGKQRVLKQPDAATSSYI